MIKKLIWLLMATLMVTACQYSRKEESPGGKGDEDTGTQLKKYYNEGRLVKEVSFKNDIRHGICRNYYDDGRLKRTIWYENGVKEDTAKWYYPSGRVYRASPYSNDELQGVQVKYYKTGRVQATLPYKHGLRTQGLNEYLPDGREVDNYPDIEHTMRDMTKTDQGVIKIFTQLSNESTDVRFYKGSLNEDGTFDPDKCTDITTSSGMGFAELRPDSQRGKSYVDIIAVYITRFHNKKLIIKRIQLPYDNFY